MEVIRIRIVVLWRVRAEPIPTDHGDHVAHLVDDERNIELNIVTITAVTVLRLRVRAVIHRVVVLPTLRIVRVLVGYVLQAPQARRELNLSTIAVDNTKEVRAVREVALMVLLVVVPVLLIPM